MTFRPTVLQTDRLVLRTPQRDDVDGLLTMLGDPEAMKYVGQGKTMNRQQVEADVDRWIALEQECGLCLWTVRKQMAQGREQVIGHCGLIYMRRSGSQTRGPEVELAYGFARSFWGQGFATEAGRAALEYGFSNLDLDSILAITYPENLASQKVLLKLDFEPLGRTEKYYDIEAEFFRRLRQPS